MLDFWTFCCINCLHVLDELRPLEEKYARRPGRRSACTRPSSSTRRDPDALAAAVERYGVHHPVLDDPEMVMLAAYAARAWPTLVGDRPRGLRRRVDGRRGPRRLPRAPAGRADRRARGEGHAAPRRRTVRAAGRPAKPCSASPARRSSCRRQPAGLRFGRAFAGRADRRRRDAGPPDRHGERGRADGPAESASFAEPQGLCLLPPARRVRRGGRGHGQ